MPDTPIPAEPSPEWLKLMAGLILSGSFIAREEREKIAAALSRLAQVEQERDASDAAIEWLLYMAGKASWPGCEADDHASQWVSDARERHKRSRQQRA
jgi:hypothetical protein